MPLPQMPQLPQFNQAHEIQLSKLQNAQSSLDMDLNDGKIDPALHQNMSQGIQFKMQGLQALKQQAKNQADQEKNAEAMKANAMEQAVRHENAAHDAQVLPERIAWIADPITGQHVAFYPESDRKWKQIEFPEENKETDNA